MRHPHPLQALESYLILTDHVEIVPSEALEAGQKGLIGVSSSRSPNEDNANAGKWSASKLLKALNWREYGNPTFRFLRGTKTAPRASRLDRTAAGPVSFCEHAQLDHPRWVWSRYCAGVIDLWGLFASVGWVTASFIGSNNRLFCSEPGSREVDDPPIPRNSSAAVSAPGARSLDSQPSMESDGPPSVDPDSMPGSEKQSPSAPKHSSTGTNVGRYHVKVSLARSEAQAEAASQGFQLRYRDDLRGTTVILSRDNVGPKGVSYGLSIGPFSSAREAARFCARVKQSARCIVRKRGTIAARDTKGTAEQSSGWQW